MKNKGEFSITRGHLAYNDVFRVELWQNKRSSGTSGHNTAPSIMILFEVRSIVYITV